jgi:hypothetical protein
MQLGSLPPRPLSLDECHDLEASDRFRAVVPMGVYDLTDTDRRLVATAVFVTDTSVVAIGYDQAAVENGARTPDDGGPPGAWTVVAEREAGADKATTEDRVRAAGEQLREWAEDQPWAEDPSGLLDAM